MSGSDSLRYQDKISAYDIETRIEHLAFLDDYDGGETSALLDGWEDELAELAALRALPDVVTSTTRSSRMIWNPTTRRLSFSGPRTCTGK